MENLIKFFGNKVPFIWLLHYYKVSRNSGIFWTCTAFITFFGLAFQFLTFVLAPIWVLSPFSPKFYSLIIFCEAPILVLSPLSGGAQFYNLTFWLHFFSFYSFQPFFKAIHCPFYLLSLGNASWAGLHWSKWCSHEAVVSKTVSWVSYFCLQCEAGRPSLAARRWVQLVEALRLPTSLAVMWKVVVRRPLQQPLLLWPLDLKYSTVACLCS